MWSSIIYSTFWFGLYLIFRPEIDAVALVIAILVPMFALLVVSLSGRAVMSYPRNPRNRMELVRWVIIPLIMFVIYTLIAND